MFIIVSIVSLVLLGGAVGLMSRVFQPSRQPDVAGAKNQIIEGDFLVRDDSYFEGDQNSKLVLVEFSDFQCPACAAHASKMQELVAAHPEMKLVYRHYPLSYHQYARQAALAAEAAGRQNKFWEMHDLLFQNQKTWGESSSVTQVFEGYAQQLGLDVEQFKADMADQALLEKINRDIADGNKANINGTPTFLLNGQRVNIFDPKFEEVLLAISDTIQQEAGGNGMEVTQ